MTQIPLYYSLAHVGNAIVDSTISLSSDLRWRLEIPKRIRRMHYHSDVLVALLREDPPTLRACHPILTINQSKNPTTLRLSRVVFSPELIDMINLLPALKGEHKHSQVERIMSLYRTLPQVVNLTSNRVDCRSENLRQLNVELPSDQEPSGLYNGPKELE